MKIIGVTGSIGMGKSTIAKHIAQNKIPVFDADKCVHTLLGPRGRKVDVVGKRFPQTLRRLNGDRYIDRKMLGNIVFSNDKKRKILENILHPEVAKQREVWLSWAKRRRIKAVCFDVPLLFETGQEKKCNLVLVVSAPFFLQKQRVLKRKDMTESKFENILNKQFNEQKKKKHADYVIKTGIGYRFSRNRVNYIINKELNEKQKNSLRHRNNRIKPQRRP